MKLNNKFALGCLVQWYEIELIEEYIQSVKNTLNLVDNKENVIVHFTLVVNQDLEKLSDEITMSEIVDRFVKLVDDISFYTDYDITNRLYTILITEESLMINIVMKLMSLCGVKVIHYYRNKHLRY